MQSGGNPAKPNLKTRASSQGNFPPLAPRMGFHSGSTNKTARGIWVLPRPFCTQNKTWATPGSLARHQAFRWNLVWHTVFALGWTLSLFPHPSPRESWHPPPILPAGSFLSPCTLPSAQPLHCRHSHQWHLSCQIPNIVSRPFLLALCKHSHHVALWPPTS